MRKAFFAAALAAAALLPNAPAAAFNPKSPAIWKPVKTNKLTGADIAGVKIGMTLDQATSALKAHNFVIERFNGTDLESDKMLVVSHLKGDDSITVAFSLYGYYEYGKRATKPNIYVTTIVYYQSLAASNHDILNASVEKLIARSEQKYGKPGHLLHAPDGTPLAIWGLQFGKFILDGLKNGKITYTPGDVQHTYYETANSRIDDFDEPALKKCEAMQKGFVDDATMACFNRVNDRAQKILSHSYAPIMVAGARPMTSGFQIILFSPYQRALQHITNHIWATSLLSNQMYRNNQKALKKQANHSAF